MIRSSTLLLFTCGCAFTLAGCQSLPPNPLPQEDVAEVRKEHREEAIARFEQQRNNAEYHAALQAWRSNDVDRCRESLENVLQRAPQHRQAGLLLAELHLHEGDAPAALALLQPLAAQHPNDAALQHTLGLVHEALGDLPAARICFGRATELAADNDFFRLSYEAALEQPSQH